MLSAAEAAAFSRGQEFKRIVRAAAALSDLYDDSALAAAVHASRNTVAGWWRGARPEPARIEDIATATGLSRDELVDFIHYDGPPPHLPAQDEAAERAEAAERSLRARPADGGSAARRAPHGRAGSARAS